MLISGRLASLQQTRALNLSKRLSSSTTHTSYAAFSSNNNTEPEVAANAATAVVKSNKIKATPKAGYKMPRLKKGEQVLAFRPSGHTKLTQPVQIYNFEMARTLHEGTKIKVVIALVLFSFIPFGMFVRNAEGNFRKAEIKKIAEKRRRRLDKEHGIDRE